MGGQGNGKAREWEGKGMERQGNGRAREWEGKGMGGQGKLLAVWIWFYGGGAGKFSLTVDQIRID